jgi:hypothetical protein
MQFETANDLLDPSWPASVSRDGEFGEAKRLLRL